MSHNHRLYLYGSDMLLKNCVSAERDVISVEDFARTREAKQSNVHNPHRHYFRFMADFRSQAVDERSLQYWAALLWYLTVKTPSGTAVGFIAIPSPLSGPI